MNINKSHLGLSMPGISPSNLYFRIYGTKMPQVEPTLHGHHTKFWRIILNFHTVFVWLQMRFFIWSLHFELSLCRAQKHISTLFHFCTNTWNTYVTHKKQVDFSCNVGMSMLWLIFLRHSLLLAGTLKDMNLIKY